MKSKPGAAMVEMGDCYAVDRAISHLNNNFLFEQKLNVWSVLLSNSAYTLMSIETDYKHIDATCCPSSVHSVSKQQAIMPGQSYELEDGSSSFKDFHGSRNNRFTSPEQAAKNRIQHPSNVLHFFNGQPDISVEVFNGVRQLERIWGLGALDWVVGFLGELNVTRLLT